jgi:hypothetical protein
MVRSSGSGATFAATSSALATSQTPPPVRLSRARDPRGTHPATATTPLHRGRRGQTLKRVSRPHSAYNLGTYLAQPSAVSRRRPVTVGHNEKAPDLVHAGQTLFSLILSGGQGRGRTADLPLFSATDVRSSMIAKCRCSRSTSDEERSGRRRTRANETTTETIKDAETERAPPPNVPASSLRGAQTGSVSPTVSPRSAQVRDDWGTSGTWGTVTACLAPTARVPAPATPPLFQPYRSPRGSGFHGRSAPSSTSRVVPGEGCRAEFGAVHAELAAVKAEQARQGEKLDQVQGGAPRVFRTAA